MRVPLVEDPGTFAVRGSVLDLWPASSELPVRVELYGDLVLSLRSFDPSEQRSIAGGAEKEEPAKTRREMAAEKPREPEKPRVPEKPREPRSQRGARLPPSSASYGSLRRARPS